MNILTLIRKYTAPVLEIGRVLAERGHEIEFATVEGQESWVNPEYDFVNKLHQLGPGYATMAGEAVRQATRVKRASYEMPLSTLLLF